MAVRRFRPYLHQVLALTIVVYPMGVSAQTAPQEAGAATKAAGPQSTEAAPTQHKFNPTGSPLDTLLSTRLWADVPPAQDFVKESRPDPHSLEYKPLTGTDPVRPKPRDPSGVAALQAELEAGIAKNAARAKPLRGGAAATAAKTTRRTKVEAKASPARPAKKTGAATD